MPGGIRLCMKSVGWRRCGGPALVAALRFPRITAFIALPEITEAAP